MDIMELFADDSNLQRKDIDKLKADLVNKTTTDRVRSNVHEHRIRALENELGKTQLMLLATIEMLKEKDLWAEDVFQAFQKKIDALDGVVDDKVTLPKKKKIVRKKKVIPKKPKK